MLRRGCRSEAANPQGRIYLDNRVSYMLSLSRWNLSIRNPAQAHGQALDIGGRTVGTILIRHSEKDRTATSENTRGLQ